MTTKPNSSTLPSYKYLFPSDISGVGYVVTSAGSVTAKDTWSLVPTGIAPYNLTPVTAIAPQVSVIRGQDATGTFASVGGDINITPGIGSVANSSGSLVIKDTAGNGGAWNNSHLSSGQYHQWFDTSGRFRVKLTAPTSETDGIVAGFDYIANTVYAPVSLATGIGATTTIAVPGAALGDFAIVSFSLDLQGITVTAYVSALNIVSVRFQNNTSGTLSLASGILRAKVIKQ